MAAQRFRFKPPNIRGLLNVPLNQIDKVVDNWAQSFKQELHTQLNGALSQSSPEYKKYLDYIPEVAHLYTGKAKFNSVLELQQKGGTVTLHKPLDEIFGRLGRCWLQVDQFEESLAAFTTCVEISERKGCWWTQRLCDRYSHLAYVHMILGNTQEQLQASMRSAAFAVVAKNSALKDSAEHRMLISLSFCNLAIQFLNCNPDISFVEGFLEDMLKAWEEQLARRNCILQEKLSSDTQGDYTEEDLCFALADFLIHNNGDAYRRILALLKCESLSASELNLHGPNLASRECQNLMKVCRVDTWHMTLNAEQPGKPRALLTVALELLEMATVEPPPEYEAFSMPVQLDLHNDGEGLPFYPGLCISIEHESAPNPASSINATREMGCATPVPAEGGKHGELEAIKRRLQSKAWDLSDRCDSREYADLGRELGKWATSSSTTAVAPIENIKDALLTVNSMIELLRAHLQHHAAKLMLQDIVLQLTDQMFFVRFKEICVQILLEYAQICGWTGDREECVKCCMRVLRLAEEHQMPEHAKCKFHVLLGISYINLNNIPQAEKEFNNARNIITQNLELAKDVEIIGAIEVAEGVLELRKGKYFARDRYRASEHIKTAVKRLETFQELLDEKYLSKDVKYGVKFNWIMASLRLSEALRISNRIPDAQHVCSKALRAAKEFKFSSLIADAACTCGNLAQDMGNFETAERYYREGLEELDRHKCDEQFLSGRLYCGLGSTLQSRGNSHLPEAEVALRHSIKAYSRVLTERTMTSHFRISTFESLKISYNHLQLCLYAVSTQAARSQQRIKVVEALVVAEQGRCRDLILNLEELSKPRVAHKKRVCADDNVGVMGWKKFDTDMEYAWGHLKKCMAICTDAIKRQNPEVQRVTFVEYTLTSSQMLISVHHSHGTQEPSTAHTIPTLPSMCSVHLKEWFKDMAPEEFPQVKEDFEWIYGNEQSQSQFNTFLQRLQEFQAVVLFEGYIEQLRGGSQPNDRKLSNLYKLLISPIASKLVVGEPVIFIPHEDLSFVPYAALKPEGGKHLIENHPIGIAPSLRTLGWATKQYTALKASTMAVKNEPMLFVADPSPLGVTMVPLKDSVREVNEIATMLPEYSTLTLIKEQATLENVISAMKTTSWCHFACHGEVIPEHPQGVLFLSTYSSEASTIEAATSSSKSTEQRRLGGCFTPVTISEDVRCMTAHAAVLSACKVGLGKKTGEGLLGMSRAFMQAGVPLVIAPLVTVKSRLSSAFMQCLYRKMVAGESVMFALRNTMVDVIKKRVKVDDDSEDDNDDDDDDGDNEDGDDDDNEWEVWDWAAWQAVGFPGVCLPPRKPKGLYKVN